MAQRVVLARRLMRHLVGFLGKHVGYCSQFPVIIAVKKLTVIITVGFSGGFCGGRKTVETEKKTHSTGTRTKNKLNPHLTPGPLAAVARGKGSNNCDILATILLQVLQNWTLLSKIGHLSLKSETSVQHRTLLSEI